MLQGRQPLRLRPELAEVQWSLPVLLQVLHQWLPVAEVLLGGLVVAASPRVAVGVVDEDAVPRVAPRMRQQVQWSWSAGVQSSIRA